MTRMHVTDCFRWSFRWRTLFTFGITINVLVYLYIISLCVSNDHVKRINATRELNQISQAEYDTLPEDNKDKIEIHIRMKETNYSGSNLYEPHMLAEVNLEADLETTHTDEDMQIAVPTDGVVQNVDKETKYAEAMVTIAAAPDGMSQNVEKETKHTEAMAKLAMYPHLRPYVHRLFRLLNKLANRRKYDNMMAMFNHLILDLWDAYSNTPIVRQGHWIEVTESKHELNCGNINKLKIAEKLGEGYIKVVHRGIFMGTEVAVKVKNMNATELQVCGQTDFPCAVYRDVRILSELLLIETLQHPLVIHMIGYCVHSGLNGSPFLEKPGVVLVCQLGNVTAPSPLTELPWREKILHAVRLSTLLEYVEDSPLGRLTLYDIELRQFVWIDGRMYLTDMDLTVNDGDKKCADLSVFPQHSLVTTEENVTNCHFTYPYQLGYEFDVQCVNGVCLHTATIHNTRALYRAFFEYLFTTVEYVFPKSLHNDINAMMRAMRTFIITGTELHKRLTVLKQMADMEKHLLVLKHKLT